ncbi:RluA family pseudouridine synthase [Tautonia sp. JC769]|uniref:RluA family pseudouridine synthase n=1 Tax=Tautonia sp. JC769 TaxID=3232135 RepID=UPI00345989E2
MSEPPDPPPTILFEDIHCLVVIKPAGLLTQGRPREGTSLEGLLRRYLDPGHPDRAYLAAIHRLDRPVSGVMVWGKTPKAARRLHEQFARRDVEKHYWAIVPGAPTPDEGLWDDWLYEDDTGLGPIVQVCHPETPRARHALTRYRVDRTGSLPEGCCRLLLWPRTGRTHQLRVQASTRGVPILGDASYGSDRPFPVGIALHARSLTIRHPILRTRLQFEAPVPGHWAGSGIILPED